MSPPPQQLDSRTSGVQLDAKANAQDDEGSTVSEGSKPPSEVQRSEPPNPPTAGEKKEVKGRLYLKPSISISTTPNASATPSPLGVSPASSPTSGAPKSRQSTTRGSSVSPQAVSATPRTSFGPPRGSPAVASPGGARGSRVFGGPRRRVAPGDSVGAGASGSESQRQLQRSGSPSTLLLSAAPASPSAGGHATGLMSTAGQSTAPGSGREQDGVTTSAQVSRNSTIEYRRHKNCLISVHLGEAFKKPD